MGEPDSLAGSTPSRAIRTTLTGHLTSGSTVVQSAFGYAFRVDRTQQNKNHVFPVQGPDVGVSPVRRRATS
jgi:hypothetical protein